MIEGVLEGDGVELGVGLGVLEDVGVWDGVLEGVGAMTTLKDAEVPV